MFLIYLSMFLAKAWWQNQKIDTEFLNTHFFIPKKFFHTKFPSWLDTITIPSCALFIHQTTLISWKGSSSRVEIPMGSVSLLSSINLDKWLHLSLSLILLICNKELIKILYFIHWETKAFPFAHFWNQEVKRHLNSCCGTKRKSSSARKVFHVLLTGDSPHSRHPVPWLRRVFFVYFSGWWISFHLPLSWGWSPRFIPRFPILWFYNWRHLRCDKLSLRAGGRWRWQKPRAHYST